jgi:hypothetical protein
MVEKKPPPPRGLLYFYMVRSILLAVALLILFKAGAQTKPKACAIAFYNVENLFDTVNDPEKDDDAFTSRGAYHYTSEMYRQKLHNTAFVLKAMVEQTVSGGPALLGLAEVESGKVLQDLISQPEIKGVYQYIWFDSPDPRGIDVALLYRPAVFKLISKKAVLVSPDGEATRDILYVIGLLDKDTVHVLVNHWPSRREGKDETASKRKQVAEQDKKLIEKIWKVNPHSHIIVMGDLNDNPSDASVVEVLGAKSSKEEAGKTSLYNPWTAIHAQGTGTQTYKKKWNLFDQVMVSGSFLQSARGWKFTKAEIFDKEFLKVRSGKQQGFPYRSWRGFHWMNGYSDHFPVVIYLEK